MQVNHEELFRYLATVAAVARQCERNAKRRYSCVEDLVAAKGIRYEFRPLPKRFGTRGNESAVLGKNRPAWYESPNAAAPPRFLRRCFENCYSAAVRPRSPWRYVEGFAMTGDVKLPVHHAWLTVADEPFVAYDPTWEDRFAEVGSAYIGIPLATSYVVRVRHTHPLNEYSALNAWWFPDNLVNGRLPVSKVQPYDIKASKLRRMSDSNLVAATA